MDVDPKKVAIVLCDQALEEIPKLRRLARVKRFFRPVPWLTENFEELGFAILMIPVIGPGLALWWFLDVPFLAAVVGNALAVLSLWALYAYNSYARYGVDREMHERAFDQLEQLNRLLPDLAASGHRQEHFSIEASGVDGLQRDLRVFRSQLLV